MAVIWGENTLYDYLLNPKKVIAPDAFCSIFRVTFVLVILMSQGGEGILGICCSHKSDPLTFV